MNARFPEAGLCLVFAFLADVYDGPVAKRLKSRTDADRAFGANFDSLIDIVGAGVVPGIILLAYGNYEGWYVPGAFLLIAAAALRLSYFNVHGLGPAATHYTGLPTDLVLLAFSALILLDVPLEREDFRVMLYGSTVLLVLLMVSPLKVRKLEGRWYLLLPIFAGSIGLGQVVRLL